MTKGIYTYTDLNYEEDKRKIISSIDIEKLEMKVKARGLKWRKLNE